MPCFHPIPALQDINDHGVVSVTLHPRGAASPAGRQSGAANLSLPCGKCIGCKIARGQEWALRCMHELKEHDHAIFVTLTYKTESLPGGGNLLPGDLHGFLKSLRKSVRSSRRAQKYPSMLVSTPPRLRYLATGEYGDIGQRPHYHAILFGVSFDDSTLIKLKPHPLYHSPTLQGFWKYGNVNFGAVTKASCAYVAGYTVKKIGSTHCDADGVVKRAPFLRVSLKPGLGGNHATRFAHDYRNGHDFADGATVKIPRYYSKVLKRNNPQISEEAVYAAAEKFAARHAINPDGFTPDRLVAGEVILKQKLSSTRSHSL